MAIPEGLRVSLNAIRETSIQDNTLYARYVPEILPDTDIGTFSASIVADQTVANEFMSRLIKRIVYTQVLTKTFRNKLKILEGERIPLGYAGQEIYINPAKGRRFNVDDFAGLLARYESDIKVQYPSVNTDIQYPVTISRDKLRNAFVSWSTLDDFVSGITNSLYNGAYIDDYRFSKNLVGNAYRTNSIQMETVSAVSSEATGKALVKALRKAYLSFQEPTSENNAWAKVGGYGNAVVTWSNPEDIILLVRNDVLAEVDVDVLADAFNISKTDFLGRVIGIDNFDKYDENGNKTFDGSAIICGIFDTSWFRIKEQDFQMDEFFNANNRCWNVYLNVVKMYNYSCFANGKLFVTSLPTVAPSTIEFITPTTSATVVAGSTLELPVITDPFQANATITYTSGTEAKATVAAKTGNNKIAVVTGVEAGTSVITATCGNVTDTITVTVTAAPETQVSESRSKK
ncbi:MAG: Ig-like domain-containing protein [Candidatus Gastranaerophilales bacterium]|nr:Ig-like domain-containing protein [Candidatus Gastranaerophilales bacterium]